MNKSLDLVTTLICIITVLICAITLVIMYQIHYEPKPSKVLGVGESTCLNKQLYYNLPTGAAPAYNTDGTRMRCE